MNIAIMRAFVEIRRLALKHTDLKDQLQEIKDRIGEHDVQLSQIYNAIENLLDEKAGQRKWDERERIGFKKQGLQEHEKKPQEILPRLWLIKQLTILRTLVYHF